jgi:hypothetical protein
MLFIRISWPMVKIWREISSQPAVWGCDDTTEGPLWGHPMPVLGALSPLLEPFYGHLSPKIDKVS